MAFGGHIVYFLARVVKFYYKSQKEQYDPTKVMLLHYYQYTRPNDYKYIT